MEQAEIAKIVRESAQDIDGKKELKCASAFELARKHGVTLSSIGKACNENDVRIAGCQLGCFQ